MGKQLVMWLAGVAIVLGARAVCAQSSAELLEKGIFAEETVGNLDQAIEIYRQVVADAKAAEVAAAQAQYRLAQCLMKQNKRDAALAAFQKVIDDYPNQSEWVAKARQQLPETPHLELQPVPWKEGEYLQLAVKLGGGLQIGTFIWTVDSVDWKGEDVWRMRTYRYILAGGDNRGLSMVRADKADFRPLYSRFEHTMLGTIDATYEPGQVKVTKPNSEEPPRTDTFDQTYYDNEQGMFVFRRLPLAEGYKAKIPIYASFGGGKVDIDLTVNGIETVVVPAGEFRCYKVTLMPVNQVFWFSSDANRYLVKFDAAGVVAELERVGWHKPEQGTTYRNDPFDFSLDLPTGWYFYEQPAGEEDSVAVVYLIDPAMAAVQIVTCRNRESIEDPKARDSVRAWAELRQEKAKKEWKELQLREDSWRESTIGGMPAASVVGDYLAGSEKKAVYSVFVFGEQTASVFTLMACDPNQLEEQKATFDRIIATFQAP